MPVTRPPTTKTYSTTRSYGKCCVPTTSGAKHSTISPRPRDIVLAANAKATLFDRMLLRNGQVPSWERGGKPRGMLPGNSHVHALDVRAVVCGHACTGMRACMHAGMHVGQLTCLSPDPPSVILNIYHGIPVLFLSYERRYGSLLLLFGFVE